ncbi:MAG: hypothetical protein K1X85_10160 [Ignavibacteria bacterium]|nr:hypothetical protein [Ignavibacteria bacterium]
MKALSVLGLIRKEEWKEFEKFAASPFFNKGRNYGVLLKLLRPFHPAFCDKKLTAEYIYKSLYPGRKFNGSVLSTVLSGLNKLCEEFFLQMNFRNDEKREIRLLREYSKRGYDPKAESFSRRLVFRLQSGKPGSMTFFENLDIIDALQQHYAMSYDKERRSRVLHEGILNLICFMILQSFVFQKELLLYGGRYAEDELNSTTAGKLLNAIDFAGLLEIIGREHDPSFIVLNLYSLLVKQLNNIEDDTLYKELRQLLEKNKGETDPETVEKLMLNMVSICNMKNNLGKKEYLKESYVIMKHLAESGFFDRLEDSPHFPPSQFRNIVKAGIALEDTDWVRRFVTDNADKLEHSLRSSLKHYSLAKIDFASGRFDSALQHLSEVQTDNLVFKLDIRKLYAMIYYETGSHESLRSLLNAYYGMVAKKGKKNEAILLRHRNFIKYLRQLLNLNEEGAAAEQLKAVLDLLKADNVSEKSWLTEKFRLWKH